MRYVAFTYYTQPSGQVDESLAVMKNLKLRELQTASVILDFKKQEVVKASVMGETIPKDWETVVAYYYEHYSATFERMFIENGHEPPVVQAEQEDLAAEAEG